MAERSRALRVTAALLVLAVALALAQVVGVQGADPRATTGHGLSIHGDLKYGPGFKHFEYANPDAPKGGDVRLPAIGTFDNLNPFILKGVAAAGLGQLFDTLTLASSDEPSSEYGLIAESVEVPADRSWVAFTLRPEARFHDGSPITADDVIWTFQTLKSKGHPFYRAYYAQVAKAETQGPRKVKFSFGAGENRELPVIAGQLPVLSKAYWSKRDFEKTTLEPPLGSGPYRVESVDAGRSIVYRRVKNYWGAKLPVRVGQDNFDTIRYDYYRDSTVALEAFKAGQYDFRQENSAKNWATAYTIPAVTQGLIKKEEIPNQVPTGMQAFVFNTRRPIFQDRRVRQALGYAFDFEWANKSLFYGAYTRTRSYFSNSELASSGLPGPEELKVLEPFRGRVTPEVFTKEYQPPVTDGSGDIRANLREALALRAESSPTRAPASPCSSRSCWTIPTSSASPCRSSRTWSDSASRRASARWTAPSTRSAWRASTSTWRWPSGPSRSPPATSRRTSGPRSGRGSRAAVTWPASATPWWTSSWSWSSRRPTARTSSPAPAPSTACSCGGSTGSRTSTSGPSASPTGTSSTGRACLRGTRSASTPGGWTRRRRRPCSGTRAKDPGSLPLAPAPCSPTSPAAWC